MRRFNGEVWELFGPIMSGENRELTRRVCGHHWEEDNAGD
jgi:hypothetical protein